MKPNKLKLYMAPFTCSHVTLTALEEIGCEYEYEVKAIFAGEHRRPEYLSLNPNGALPALVVDGVAMTQNAAILQFLAEVYPEALLLPKLKTPHERFEVNALFSTITADLHPKIPLMRLPFVVTKVKEAYEDMGKIAAESVCLKLDWINKKLSNQQWLLGDSWSILDAYMAWAWTGILGGKQISANEYPAINRMTKKHNERPGARRAAEIDGKEMAKIEARGAGH